MMAVWMRVRPMDRTSLLAALPQCLSLGALLLAAMISVCAGCGPRAGAPRQPGAPGGANSVFSTDLAQRLEEHGAKTGDVQASLLWNNYNDLDLHVIDPNGEEIYFLNKLARSGGELDVDMNAWGPESDEPVENIYFPRGGAPAGRYSVLVHYYAKHDDADATEFRCEVLVGARVHKFSGTLSDGDPAKLVYEFTLRGRPAPPPVRRPQFRLFSPIKL